MFLQRVARYGCKNNKEVTLAPFRMLKVRGNGDMERVVLFHLAIGFPVRFDSAFGLYRFLSTLAIALARVAMNIDNDVKARA